MNPIRKNIESKAGAPPGTLIYIGEESYEKVRVTVFSYNATEYEEQEITQLDRLGDFIKPGRTTWVNVDGVHHPELVNLVCDRFNIHPLVQEDIVNTEQRPKMENYDDYLYFVLKMIDLDEDQEINAEQVSIILAKDFILSFQEEPGDIWDPIRSRIRALETRLGSMGADYLGYRLMDSILDRYFPILEMIGERVDNLEEELIEEPNKKTLTQVYELRSDLIFLRKSSWPMREIVTEMQRVSSNIFDDDLKVFLRDFQDHIIRVSEKVETYRDTTSSMVDLYMSSVSIRMNEVMKVLTVISTIFIPLTFITGLYGMNLDFMPEIHSPWSYPIVLGIMALMVVGQLMWFRRKKWL